MVDTAPFGLTDPMVCPGEVAKRKANGVKAQLCKATLAESSLAFSGEPPVTGKRVCTSSWQKDVWTVATRDNERLGTVNWEAEYGVHLVEPR